MTGTIINIIAVLVGSGLGLLFGSRLSERFHQIILRALGLVPLVIGVQMALGSANILIVLGSVAVGGILGEWWNIEGGLNRLGGWLEARTSRGQGRDETGSARFIRGYVTTSLLFCVGPMTVLGSIQDGLTGNYQILAIKSMLDGFGALAFASSLGVGVMFSALTILVYQDRKSVV